MGSKVGAVSMGYTTSKIWLGEMRNFLFSGQPIDIDDAWLYYIKMMLRVLRVWRESRRVP